MLKQYLVKLTADREFERLNIKKNMGNKVGRDKNLYHDLFYFLPQIKVRKLFCWGRGTNHDK